MQTLMHNLSAQFANRQLNITTEESLKASEKLSSGYRINRSADDAAGLQISEKLRWQIRGLDTGAHNINDGISLIQTADGALSEVHSVLQRVRELSIQAYNDTNTQSDRNAIQAEIDESLKEIDRIANDTTFNTKQILLGNPKQEVQVTADQTVGIQVRETRPTTVPSWLAVDSDMTVHGTYDLGNQVSDNMKITDSVGTPQKYYGAKNSELEAQGYQHGGEWTSTIKDNPSAKIDFKGLIDNSNTVVDLYNNLFSLIGTKISFCCGTCRDYLNSIAFGGNEQAMTIEDFETNPVVTDVLGNVNLSAEGYFKEVQDLLNTYGENYETGTHADKIPGEKDAVKNLATEIAKKLRNKVFTALDDTMQDHFDRVIVANNDPFSLYVYDYRDNQQLTNSTIADTSINTTATVTYLKDISMVQPGEKAIIESPMMIECGALAPNAIPLNLPNASGKYLGIDTYKINRYQESESYSDTYKQKLKEYYDSKQTTVKQGTRTERVVKTPAQAPVYSHYITYENGEAKQHSIMVQAGKPAEYEDKQVTYNYTEITYSKPKPVAGAGDIVKTSVYDSDSVEIIDDAIAKVSRMRSNLGALQNRLEHAYQINTNTGENSQAAESRIRDTDIAKVMVSYSQCNILKQAGEAVLAQANQMSKGILELLQ